MKAFLVQFVKFSIVGITAFLIDYVLFLVLNGVGVHYLIANLISYVISTIYNFVMSMRFVFAGKEGQTRAQQFVIFVVLSVIGLGLNTVILRVLIGGLGVWAWISKIVSTFIVMIFNFVTRKIFLEDRKSEQQVIAEERERLEHAVPAEGMVGSRVGSFIDRGEAAILQNEHIR